MIEKYSKEKGSKVLIFADNKTAIIYRDSKDLIINAGPIILSGNLDDKKNKVIDGEQRGLL
ncbi:MAG: hypothetical protein WAQ22_03015 [Candidatus Saccharimonas sp.]